MEPQPGLSDFRASERRRNLFTVRESAHDATLEGWARALELRDREAEGHCRRVAEAAGRV